MGGGGVVMEGEEPGTSNDLGRIGDAVSSTSLGASLFDVAEEPRMDGVEGNSDGCSKASSGNNHNGNLKVVPVGGAPNTTVTAPTPTSTTGEMGEFFLFCFGRWRVCADAFDGF